MRPSAHHYPALNRSALMDRRKSIIARRIWRMTADASHGEFVDFDPTQSEPAAGLVDIPLRVLDPAPVVDWRASSYDLLNGLEVRDHSDSIPGELFERLFKR